MAREWGIHPMDYAAKTPHRIHQALLAWLQADWNKPSRGDHYLMQIAREIRAGNVKRPRDLLLSHFVITFDLVSKAAPGDPKVAAALAKAKWAAAVSSGGSNPMPVRMVYENPR